MKYPSLVLSLLMLSACPAPQVVPTPTPPPAVVRPADPIKVGMLVQVHSRSGPGIPRMVEPNQRLRSGDRLSLLLKADEPAYIYLFFVNAQRRAQPLYAPVNNQPILASEWVRVPALPAMLELDQKVGEENILLIAQRSPLAPDAVRARVQEELDRGILTCVKGPGCIAQALTRTANEKERAAVRASTGALDSAIRVAEAKPLLRNQPPKEESPPPLGPDDERPLDIHVTVGADVKLTPDPDTAVLRFRFQHTK